MTLHATVSSSDHRYILDIDVVPLKVDWSALIEDIKHFGYSYNQQADAIGVTWSTFQNWKDGSQPGFSYGHAIIILHTKVCGTPITEQRFVEFAKTSNPTPVKKSPVLTLQRRD